MAFLRENNVFCTQGLDFRGNTKIFKHATNGYYYGFYCSKETVGSLYKSLFLKRATTIAGLNAASIEATFNISAVDDSDAGNWYAVIYAPNQGTYGSIGIVHANPTDYKVFFRHGAIQSDGSITWNTEHEVDTDITAIPSNSKISLALMPSGKWALALTAQYSGDTNDYVRFYTSSDDTPTTEGEWTLRGNSGYSYAFDNFSIGACNTSGDNVVFFYMTTDPSECHAKRWNGSTLSSEKSTSGLSLDRREISYGVVDSSGDTHCVVMYDTNTIAYHITYDESAETLSYETIASGLTDASDPAIAIDVNGKLHVTWRNGSTGNVHYYTKEPAGSWTDEESNLPTDIQSADNSTPTLSPYCTGNSLFMGRSDESGTDLYVDEIIITVVGANVIVPAHLLQPIGF